MPNLTPEQTLALAYVPTLRREAVRALWRLDAVLKAARSTGSQPMIRRIKLAWWDEALQRLDTAPPPAEPTLEALAHHVIPLDVTGAEMADLATGWAQLTDEYASAEVHEYASARGGTLFRLTARLLGHQWPQVEAAGEAWAIVDLARGGERPDLSSVPGKLPPDRWPTPLRPLGMLAVLAGDDVATGFSRQGSPLRLLRMLRHRITGR